MREINDTLVIVDYYYHDNNDHHSVWTISSDGFIFHVVVERYRNNDVTTPVAITDEFFIKLEDLIAGNGAPENRPDRCVLKIGIGGDACTA